MIQRINLYLSLKLEKWCSILLKISFLKKNISFYQTSSNSATKTQSQKQEYLSVRRILASYYTRWRWLEAPPTLDRRKSHLVQNGIRKSRPRSCSAPENPISRSCMWWQWLREYNNAMSWWDTIRISGIRHSCRFLDTLLGSGSCAEGRDARWKGQKSCTGWPAGVELEHWHR